MAGSRLRGWQKASFLALSLLLAATAAGCGAGANSSPAAGGADKTLVVYSAGPKGLEDTIAKGFEAKTGIKVQTFESTTGKILARLAAEKDHPVADVVVLASWSAALGMKKDGLVEPYAGAANADKIYQKWQDPDHELFAYSASALGIVYNTKLVQNPPKDWSDLAGPAWKNKVNMPDPALSGSAMDFVAGYINAGGQPGWNLFQQYKANGVSVAGANQQALDPVITGAKSAVVAGVDYMTLAAKAKGEPVDVVYPASGTVVSLRPALILKTAPDQQNAKLFIDYLLSDQGQKDVAQAYLLPGRSDIQVDGRPGAGQIQQLNYNWDQMAQDQKADEAKFSAIFK